MRDDGVRAISLDIWGTLLGSDPAFKPARNDLLRRAFAADRAAAEFDRAMRQADRDADEVCMAQGRDVGFAERIRLTLHRLGVTPSAEVDDAAPELLARQRTLALQHPPRPLHAGLPDAVRLAAKRMPVVLTSNTGMLPGGLMRELLDAAGFGDWAGGIFSNETGWAKPDPRIFAATWQVIRENLTEPSSPRDVIHVGDNPRADVEGAAAFGMRSALVTSDGESTLAVLRQIEGAR